MCGIVGAVAMRDIVPVLIEGLRRREYRGYDSCGVAVQVPADGGKLRRARTVSRVADLASQVRESGLTGSTGICHTRWATHGAPVTANAHPIFSRDEIAVVHNGIIENCEQPRTVKVYAGAAELGPYRHFMQKEIFEQPQAVADTLEGVVGVAPEIFGDGAKEVFAEVEARHLKNLRHLPAALARGTGVDKPRNLAKSVTVE